MPVDGVAQSRRFQPRSVLVFVCAAALQVFLLYELVSLIWPIPYVPRRQRPSKRGARSLPLPSPRPAPGDPNATHRFPPEDPPPIACLPAATLLAQSARVVRGEPLPALAPRDTGWGVNLVITTWFKVEEHSKFAEKLQKQTARGDELEYLRWWYKSLARLGLDAVILENGWMNASARRQFTTRHIRVWPMDLPSCCPSNPCPLSLLDWRWLVYAAAVAHFRARYAILTDGRDVSFRADPFPFMHSLRQSYALFFGSEYMPVSELGEIELPYRNCYGGWAAGTAPFAYNAGVVAGQLVALRFLLQHIVFEVLTVVAGNRKARDCDMAVMNHVMHSRVIPNSSFGIFTGLPFIKDPQLKRVFKKGQAGPAMVALGTEASRWRLPTKGAAPEPLGSTLRLGFTPEACHNCTEWMMRLGSQGSDLLRHTQVSPRWTEPAHCVMLTYVRRDQNWTARLPPRWGALVLFHDGWLAPAWESGRFARAAVKLVRVDPAASAWCAGCSPDELQWLLYLAYLRASPLMYAVILERLEDIIRADASPCDFVKQSRHFKFLNKISLFTGGRTRPLHYLPTLQRAYTACYGASVDGPTAFAYEPVLVAGFTATVVGVVQGMVCEVLCRMARAAAVVEAGLHPALCLWPAFNHIVHGIKTTIKVWSQGLPVYNNQEYWHTGEGYFIEHKWNEHGPCIGACTDGAPDT